MPQTVVDNTARQEDSNVTGKRRVFATRRRPASIACIEDRHESCWTTRDFNDANGNRIKQKCHCEHHEEVVVA